MSTKKRKKKTNKLIEKFEGEELVFKSRSNLLFFHNILDYRDRGLIKDFDIASLLANEKTSYSKFNARKITIDGFEFDSLEESRYYLHLLDLLEDGTIIHFDLQPEFQLLDSIKLKDRTLRGVKYIADFTVYYADGKKEHVDVKGFETPDFIIKQKMFHYFYKDETLKILTYKKRDGGWIELHEYERLKRERKKNRNKRKNK